MVAYIIHIAKELASQARAFRDVGYVFMLLRALPEELNRLDPRDFVPAARADFVFARIQARQWATASTIVEAQAPQITAMAERVISALEHYGGDGSQVAFRSFAFIKDTYLRQIIERDYRELRLKVFPSRAWKSTVVLAGSILEAILLDHLISDTSVQAKAKASKKAPKDRAGTVRDPAAGDWKLVDMIEVAADIGLLPADRAKSFDQVLRDYRNFVHPKKELRAKHPCTEAEALMSVGALEGACNILT